MPSIRACRERCQELPILDYYIISCYFRENNKNKKGDTAINANTIPARKEYTFISAIK
jgi:hypothetical protein